MAKEIKRGRIKFWNGTDGYGFIRMLTGPKETADVFYNRSGLDPEYTYPLNGDFVEFTVRRTSKGLHAQNIVLVRTG